MEEKENVLFKTAMKSPEHLKAWLEATGRKYIVINSVDLVNALWPQGRGPEALQTFQQCLEQYVAERLARGLPEMLTRSEADEAITTLVKAY